MSMRDIALMQDMLEDLLHHSLSDQILLLMVAFLQIFRYPNHLVLMDTDSLMKEQLSHGLLSSQSMEIRFQLLPLPRNGQNWVSLSTQLLLNETSLFIVK